MLLRRLRAHAIPLIKKASMPAICVLINIFGHSYFDYRRNGSCSRSFDSDFPLEAAHGKSSPRGR
jgi:hypothetical protein